MPAREADLVRRAQAGDQRAWDSIVAEHRQSAFRLAYLTLGDPDEAEDVAQEVFIRATRYLHRFDRTRPLRPWLLRIAANLARNRLRSIGRYWRALRRARRPAAGVGDILRRLPQGQPMKKRALLFVLPMAAASLACTFACDLIQQAAELARDFDPDAVVAPPPAQTFPEPLSDDPIPPEDPSTSEPPPSASIPADIERQMDQIEREVVELRGLQPTGPVARGLLAPEELRQYVIDDFLQDYTPEEAHDDVRTLALFGLIDPQYDLLNLYLELYHEQVAGFYDDEIKQMFVVQGAGFGGPERITHAHEYVHALQDQIWNLSEGLGYNDEECEADSERCAAVQALVEGDATLLEEQWLVTYATQEDFEQLREFFGSFQSPVFDSAPTFLQQDFLFPYQEGYLFVQHIFQQGGWAAVDALYDDPPRSTEQILHPELYPEDVPLRVQAPDLAAALGSPWRELDQDVLGEWFTRLTLLEWLSPQLTEPAAAGWGGDYYVALYDEVDGQGALVLLSAWDTVRDAHEFYEAFRDYGQLRYREQLSSSTTQTVWVGDSSWASIEISGDQTLWVHAPDAVAGEQLRAAVEFPASVSSE